MKDKRKIAENIQIAFCIIGVIAILLCVQLQKHKIFDFSLSYGSPISWPFFVGIILFLIPGIFGFFTDKIFMFRVDVDLTGDPLLAKVLSTIFCLIGLSFIAFDLIR